MVREKGLSDDEREELKEIFSLEKQEDIKDVKIIKDQEQFSLKIPRDFAREMNINSETDFFRFILRANNKDQSKKVLHAKLVKDKE